MSRLLAVISMLALGWSGAGREQLPGGPATVVFDGGRSSTGWLPVTLYRGRYLYMTGRVNGVETDVVVDSGAGATVIDESLARRLGLVLEGGVKATGVGGSVPAKLGRDVRLELGPMAVMLPAVVVIDLDGIGRQLDRAMPVILGQDVFRAAVVDIDYARNRLAFHDPGTFAIGAGFRTLALHADRGRYQIDARLEDLAPERFELDTGGADPLIVFAAYTRAHAAIANRTPLSTRQIGGVGGSSIARLGTVRRFALGDDELADVPAVFHDGSAGAFATGSSAGSIGAGLLRRFRVIFDVPQRRLHLAPTTDPAAPFAKDRVGIQVVREAMALRVAHVAAGSPAAGAGLVVGDRIVAVNGASIPQDYWSWWQDVSAAPAGGIVEFRDSRGRTRRVELADYY